MSNLALLDPDQIPDELLRDSAAHIPHLSNPIVQEQVSKDLRRFSLITRNPEEKTVTIHRLVRRCFVSVSWGKMQLGFENGTVPTPSGDSKTITIAGTT